jgi:hypothetical protein
MQRLRARLNGAHGAELLCRVLRVPDFLQLTKDAYSASTSYLDSNYRKRWEENIRMFQSRHPTDSKYNSDSYKHRSKLFRPKTRSVVRKTEAAAASAYFSNLDVVNVNAQNTGSKELAIYADVYKELLNYRLQKTIPWFVTLMGAVQETMVMGAVCSYQEWEYKKVKGEVKVDQPSCKLVPLENLRFDPNADWTDPVNSSPYWFHAIPMYVCDVEAMMTSVDDKTGQPKWTKFSRDEIAQSKMDFDSTRQTRQESRQDSKTETGASVKEFDVCWVMRCFMRWDDEDHVYYTLGTQHLLSEPVPLEEAYFIGERPYVLGVAVIEAHKALPESIIHLGSDLQREANEIANQRMDNVKLVLNKRWLVKRGKNVDTASLNRNVPGGVTMVDDITTDVQELNWPDVTQSAFEEQNRVNVDYDDLVGAFSSGSVATNRQLNETVGGMALLNQGANAMTEYTLRTITETWVEKVLVQLLKLEQEYETDLTVLAIAAGNSKVVQEFKVKDINLAIKQDLLLTVNVGMNATDPMMKFQKFMGAIQGISQMMAAVPMGLDTEEITKEAFSLIGYKDGERFAGEGNPQMQQMQQQMQMMQQELQACQQQLMEKDMQAAQAKMQASQKEYQNATKMIGMQAKMGEMEVERSMQDAEGTAITQRIDMSRAVDESELADADIRLKAAQEELIKAQTLKTQAEAKVVPQMAKMKAQAANKPKTQEKK